MVETLLNLVSWALMLAGGVFGVIGGIGLLRFPDFYTRLHACGVTETLCAILIVLGLVLQSGFSLLSFKMLLILIFLLFTAPTASHALARAAMVDTVEPLLGDAAAGASEVRGEPSSNT